jgi:hypothetical protein
MNRSSRGAGVPAFELIYCTIPREDAWYTNRFCKSMVDTFALGALDNPGVLASRSAYRSGRFCSVQCPERPRPAQHQLPAGVTHSAPPLPLAPPILKDRKTNDRTHMRAINTIVGTSSGQVVAEHRTNELVGKEVIEVHEFSLSGAFWTGHFPRTFRSNRLVCPVHHGGSSGSTRTD